MKKTIGILGVALIAATMFFNSNVVSRSHTDTNLASLVSINSANAEGGFFDDILWKEVMVPVTYTESNGYTIDISVLGSGGSWGYTGTTKTYTINQEVCVDGNSICGLNHWW